MFVLVSMQLRNHTDAQPIKLFKRRKCYKMRYIYDIEVMREKEISLRKWSGGTAQFRTLEETLPPKQAYSPMQCCWPGDGSASIQASKQVRINI